MQKRYKKMLYMAWFLW